VSGGRNGGGGEAALAAAARWAAAAPGAATAPGAVAEAAAAAASVVTGVGSEAAELPRVVKAGFRERKGLKGLTIAQTHNKSEARTRNSERKSC
jgi:hypothetical protein